MEEEMNALIVRLNKHMMEVGKVRDKIDETISDLQHLRDNCQTARDALETARDALSELV